MSNPLIPREQTQENSFTRQHAYDYAYHVQRALLDECERYADYYVAEEVDESEDGIYFPSHTQAWARWIEKCERAGDQEG